MKKQPQTFNKTTELALVLSSIPKLKYKHPQIEFWKVRHKGTGQTDLYISANAFGKDHCDEDVICSWVMTFDTKRGHQNNLILGWMLEIARPINCQTLSERSLTKHVWYRVSGNGYKALMEKGED